MDAISRSQALLLNPIFKILLHEVTTLQDEFQCVSIMLLKDKPKQVENVVNLHRVNIKICNIIYFLIWGMCACNSFIHNITRWYSVAFNQPYSG